MADSASVPEARPGSTMFARRDNALPATFAFANLGCQWLDEDR
jgi:hypothetical protein